MKANHAIEVEGLTRRFGHTVAVNDLTLEVSSGEVFGFLGHNGAGKTTTVRLLNGILTPSGGTALVLGLSPTHDGPALRHRTGVLTETASLEERLTARQNLHIYADLFDVPRSEVGRRVEELLATFDLANRADEKVGGYSKGMKQRLALARALLHEPELLFLDEPTSGLDPVAARQVHELIVHLSRDAGHTVFLCTHNLAEAQMLCHRVAVLEHGRLVALGTPAQLSREQGQGFRLEIEVAPEESPLALQTLRNLSYVREVTHENGIVGVSGVERDSVPGILSSLINAGIRVYQVTRREPSLEDVYFALHGEKGGSR